MSWMRVVATPLASNFASSRRRTTVSMAPRLSAGSTVRGAPLNFTVPVNGCEPSQKKPAGMGSLAKLVCAKPATVIHRSTPLWMASPAKTGAPETKAATIAIRATERIKDFILRSFLKLWIIGRAPERPGRTIRIYKGLVRQRGRKEPAGEAAVRRPPPAGGLLVGAEIRVRGLGLDRAGHAGPDAVQVIGGTAAVGLIGVRAGRAAVAGLVRALSHRAGRRRDLLGQGRRQVRPGGRVPLEHGRGDAGHEVRGGRQHGVRPAVAVGVDLDAGRVLRRLHVGPDRVAAGPEVDAAGCLPPAALGPGSPGGD